MRKYILFLSIVFIFINFFIFAVPVQYISFEKIRNMIESANDGDTVNIPIGTCVFKSSISINKNIVIKGAGVDKTIFYNYQTDESKSVLYIKNNEKPIRITGITFQGKGQNKNNSNKSQFIRWSNSVQLVQITGFRIDHCKFIDGGKYSISISGKEDIFGVIDHCSFINASTECICVFGAGTGDLDWSRKDPLGTEKAVFIEDCSFIYNKLNFPTGFCSAVASNNGARYVFRYNKLSVIAPLNSTQIDMHGNWFGDRGGYSVEIYNNNLFSEHSWCGIYMRGGRGVIFNNKFSGDYNDLIVLANDGSYLPSAANPRDKKYPARDQINNFFIWNNYLNNKLISVHVIHVANRGTEQLLIQKNRDYFEPADSKFGNYNGTGKSFNDISNYKPYIYPHPLSK
jgi:hypothetical protein